MKQILFIINAQPTNSGVKSVLKIIQENLGSKKLLHIYFEDNGVYFLSDAYWEQIYHAKILFYADASDVQRHGMKYREEIVFSSKKSFARLRESVDQIIYINNARAKTKIYK
ncbi:MAG: hypothetical protein AB7W47_08955 [Calditrichaceae bacterium]